MFFFCKLFIGNEHSDLVKMFRVSIRSSWDLMEGDRDEICAELQNPRSQICAMRLDAWSNEV